MHGFFWIALGAQLLSPQEKQIDLLSIAQKMEGCKRKFLEKKDVKKEQKEILKELDGLIASAEKEEAVIRPGRPETSKPAARQDSTINLMDRINNKFHEDSVSQRQRMSVLNSIEKFIGYHYRELIEQYYRRLARGDRDLKKKEYDGLGR